MSDSGVADPGQVTRGGLLAVEVPDCLVGFREVVGQEAAAVGLGEDAGVAPPLPGRVTDLLWHRTEVEDIDHEQVAGFGALYADWATEHVRVAEIHVAHIVGRIVVANLRVGPFSTLDAELVSRPYHRGHGNIRMPPVVARNGLVPHRLGLVDAEDYFWHLSSLPSKSSVHALLGVLPDAPTKSPPFVRVPPFVECYV